MKLNEVKRGSINLNPVELTIQKLLELGAIKFEETIDDGEGPRDVYRSSPNCRLFFQSDEVVEIGREGNNWYVIPYGQQFDYEHIPLAKDNIHFLKLFKIVPLPTNKNITEATRGSLSLDPVEVGMKELIDNDVLTYEVENEESVRYTPSEGYLINFNDGEASFVIIDFTYHKESNRWWVSDHDDAGELLLTKNNIERLKLYKQIPFGLQK